MDPDNLSKVGGGGMVGSFGLRVYEIQPWVNPRTTWITNIDKEEGLRPIFGHNTNEF